MFNAISLLSGADFWTLTNSSAVVKVLGVVFYRHSSEWAF